MIPLIDGDLVAYRACAAGSRDGETLEQVCARFDSLVDEFIWDAAGWSTDVYHMYFTGYRNYRKEIIPSYKANRKSSEKPRYLSEVITHAVEHWSAEVCNGYEADDGICMKAYELGLDKVVIVSADKDFRQIPTTIYSTYDQKTTVVTEEEAEYNFWKQALTGDSVDNIKGIPGIGPRKAEKILSKEEYGYWGMTVAAAYEEYVENGEDPSPGSWQLAKNMLDDTLLQIRLLRSLKEYEEIRSQHSLS